MEPQIQHNKIQTIIIIILIIVCGVLVAWGQRSNYSQTPQIIDAPEVSKEMEVVVYSFRGADAEDMTIKSLKDVINQMVFFKKDADGQFSKAYINPLKIDPIFQYMFDDFVIVFPLLSREACTIAGGYNGQCVKVEINTETKETAYLPEERTSLEQLETYTASEFITKFLRLYSFGD